MTALRSPIPDMVRAEAHVGFTNISPIGRRDLREWLDDAIADDRVTPAEFRLLYKLWRWLEDHPGIYPTKSQIATELGCSVATIGRLTSRSEDSGFLNLPRIPGSGRGASSLIFSLGSPPPRLARAIRTEVQGGLFDDDESRHPRSLKSTPALAKVDIGADFPVAHTCARVDCINSLPVGLKENLSVSSQGDTAKNDRQTDSLDPHPELPGTPATDDDFLREQFERIDGVLGGATLWKVRDVVQKFGEGGDIALEQAIDLSVKHHGWSFGFIVTTMENAKLQGVPLKIAMKPLAIRPPAAAPPPKPAEVNQDDAPLSPDEIPGLIDRAGEFGPMGSESWLALYILRREVKIGRLPAADVPAEFLDPNLDMKRPAGGPRRQTCPPGAVGGPSPGPLNYTAKFQTRKN